MWMSVTVRTIETGEVPERMWDPPAEVLARYRDAYGGSLRHWVETVRDESCQCYGCLETIEKIGRGESIIMVDIRFPRSFTERLHAAYQDFRGIDRNIHGVSAETAANALHDSYGNRASALFTCGECYSQHGHHREGEWWPVDGEPGEKLIYRRAVGDFPLEEYSLENDSVSRPGIQVQE